MTMIVRFKNLAQKRFDDESSSLLRSVAAHSRAFESEECGFGRVASIHPTVAAEWLDYKRGQSTGQSTILDKSARSGVEEVRYFL